MRIGSFGQGLDAGKLIFSGLVAVGLSGCGGLDHSRYVGRATTSQGVCGLGFGADGTATSTLVVRGGDVEFAPSDGVTVLPGHMDGGGHVVAGSSVIGADKKPFPQVFEGERKGDAVSGVFGTPRCRAAVVLKRG